MSARDMLVDLLYGERSPDLVALLGGEDDATREGDADLILRVYAHELAEKIRQWADDANIPGSPVSSGMIRGLKQAAYLIDPEVT